MSLATSEDVWTRTKAGWHAAFVVFALVTAVLVTVDASVSPGRRAGVLALLVVLCAWYAVTAARVLHEPHGQFGLAYVVLAVPLVVALFALVPVGSVMLCGLYPQIWALLPTRRAVLASACTSVGVSAAIVLDNGFRSGVIAAVLVITGVGLLLAVLLGVWITKIIDQSQERAALVSELEAAKTELAAVSHEAGVLAERERLARDLHDTVAQGCTSVLILLQAARDEVDRDVAACRAHLALAEQTTRENVAEIRALVASLTPAALADAPLPAALGRLTDRLGRELGIAATMTVTGTHRALPPNHEVALLRCTQEALANVRKHSGAGRVGVELGYHDDQVTLRVGDDGRGFDPAAQPSGGFGLQGLRDRVAGIGGSFSVRAAPGGGVTIAVSLPSPERGECG